MEEEQGGGKEGAGSRGSWSRDCRVELHDLKLVVEDEVAVEAWETEEALRLSFLVFFIFDTRFVWMSCRTLLRLLVLVTMVCSGIRCWRCTGSPQREAPQVDSRPDRRPRRSPGAEGWRGE